MKKTIVSVSACVLFWQCGLMAGTDVKASKEGRVEEGREYLSGALAVPGCPPNWMRESRQTYSSGTGTEPWCE